MTVNYDELRKRRCGGCFYAEPMSGDLTKRGCLGAPPIAHPVMGPNGPLGMMQARPTVSIGDKACSLWLPKDESVAQAVAQNSGLLVQDKAGNGLLGQTVAASTGH